MSPRDFRAKQAVNPHPCCDDCPGWCLSLNDERDEGQGIERCDACWNGYDDSVTDEDAAALPEAQWLAAASGLEQAS